jgi:hypothetical protein
MRKLSIAAVTAIAALVLASVALAANVYTVDGSTKPGGKGSKSKPIPIQLGFDFQVESDDPTQRGTPIETYAIGSEGLVTYPKVMPTCTFSQANRDGSVSPKCKKARVGGGLVQNVVGPAASPTVKIFCNLDLNLYNISGLGKNGGMAIRIDGDPKDPPLSDPNDKTINCPTPIHGAIKAKFVKTKIGGLPASDLRFTVPPELLHPSGLDTTVRNTISKILKKTGKVKIGGKKRKVGFYSKIGCKGGKRTIQATFTDEQGDVFKATKNKKC